jgi:site-specific recombinase XerD
MQTLFMEFMEAKKAIRLSPKTLQNYEYQVGRFVDWLGERELTQQLIHKYFAQLEYTNLETIATHARGVRVFLRFHGIELDVPIPSLKRQERLTQDSDTVTQALTGCTIERDEVLILFLFDSGTRRGETANIKWKHVDFATGLVQVPDGKTGARTIVIGSKTLKALKQYRNGQGENDSLFGITGEGIHQALQRVGKRSGVKLTAQSFRRGFASEAIRNGMNIVHVQSLMGHADIQTTRRYITVNEQDLIKAHKQFGPV